jgi:hypothetical protein
MAELRGDEMKMSVPGDAGYEVERFAEKPASPIGETVLTEREINKIWWEYCHPKGEPNSESYLRILCNKQDAHTRSIVIPETRREVAKAIRLKRESLRWQIEQSLFTTEEAEAEFRRWLMQDLIPEMEG